MKILFFFLFISSFSFAQFEMRNSVGLNYIIVLPMEETFGYPSLIYTPSLCYAIKKELSISLAGAPSVSVTGMYAAIQVPVFFQISKNHNSTKNTVTKRGYSFGLGYSGGIYTNATYSSRNISGVYSVLGYNFRHGEGSIGIRLEYIRGTKRTNSEMSNIIGIGLMMNLSKFKN